MAPRTSSQVIDKVRKPFSSRRSWTRTEEETLVNALKDLVTGGQKADNGFRQGYLGLLEAALARELPGTDIRAIPHISSKIHVWKKQFGLLFTLLDDRSGFEWNDTTNMIEVKDDIKWQDFLKMDSNAKGMRYKSFPFYPDWLEIFGKDRATGQNAEGFAEAVQEVLQSGNQSRVASQIHDYTPEEIPNDENDQDDVVSNNGGGTSTGKSKKGGGEASNGKSKRAFGEADAAKSKEKAERKKKKSREDPGMMEVIANAWKATENCLTDIVKRLGDDPVTEEDRQNVFVVLAQIDGLCDEDQLVAAQYLCKDKKNMDIFFTCPDPKKALMVDMILAGKFA